MDSTIDCGDLINLFQHKNKFKRISSYIGLYAEFVFHCSHLAIQVYA